MALLKGYRLRRGPALAVLLVVGLLGSAVILAVQLRPDVQLYDPVTVADAAVGTAYAVDDQVCVVGGQVGAVLASVDVETADGLDVAVGLPPDDRPPVIAFPVQPGALAPVRDARVPGGDLLCLRLLLTPSEQGTVAAPPVQLRLRYGPLDLFRRTVTVRPPTTVEADRTGSDPRLAGS